MNGLELSRRYFETCGLPMLETEFPHLLPYLAVGAVGSGSDRYGFDDDLSRDHDFEPGFCLFLPDESVVSRRDAFLLERAYAKLPDEFMGVKRQRLSPVGGNRNGPIRTADFYTDKVGEPNGELTLREWLTLPDYTLAEATNGEVFQDGYGEFTRIRESLLTMPEDIRRKRMAGHLLLMAQAGQYNLARCYHHGEPEAARLALHEFCRSALSVLFLLGGRYMPYYKWSFRAAGTLPEAADILPMLSDLLLKPLTETDQTALVEAVAGKIADRLRRNGYSAVNDNELERHAYAVNDGIGDGTIRTLHILAAV